MVYKEKDGYFYQLAYGDCLKRWFLNCGKIGKHDLGEHLIKEDFRTKAEGMKRFNEVFKEGFAVCEDGESDIENFSKEQLQDELLKVVDEMSNRGYSLKWMIDHIQHGKRQQ